MFKDMEPYILPRDTYRRCSRYSMQPLLTYDSKVDYGRQREENKEEEGNPFRGWDGGESPEQVTQTGRTA